MQKLKEYLISSAYTFLAVFLLVLMTFWDTINEDVFNKAVWASVLLACVRAAIKATGQYLIPNLINFVKERIKKDL